MWVSCHSIVAYQDYQDQDYQDHNGQKEEIVFSHVGLSAHAHNNYCARGQSSRINQSINQ